MKLSIIIVNYNVDREVIQCLESIKNNIDTTDYELIVVDNSPIKKLKEKLRRKRKVTLIENEGNFGYGKACNIGVRHAKGEYIFILNPDTRFVKGSIYKLIDKLNNKRIGAVAPCLIFKRNIKHPQGTKILTPIRALFALTFFGKIFPENPIRKDYYGENEINQDKFCDVLPGTAFIIKKDLFLKIGGFDEHFFLYFEEFDFFKRLKEKGYKMIISKELEIFHKWGESTKKEKNITKFFRDSRFYYFKKHYGFITSFLLEIALRTRPIHILLVLVLLLSLFLRIHKIADAMIFLGDQGWFYLSALEMITSGKVPLVGIPSSVVWLHQGPLATYIIAFALIIGRLNPIAPAIVFAILDTFTIFFIYKIGQKLFNKWVSLAAVFFYATSPLVVISARTPYHTTPVPFFAAFLLFLVAFYNFSRSKLYNFLIFLIFGLLLQLELSNAVFVFIIVSAYLFKLIIIRRREILYPIGGFILGILPFILFDLSNNFVQTFGFPLWIINRARLFFGISLQDTPTIVNTPSAFSTVLGQIAAIFSYNFLPVLIVFAALLMVTFFIAEKKYKKYFSFLFLSLLIPLASFFIHAAPGVAYFPLLFVPIALLTGFTVYTVSRKIKLFYFTLFILGVVNTIGLINNNYFVTTDEKTRVLPVNSYSYGFSYKNVEELALFIKKNSGGRDVNLSGNGILKMFPASLDNLRYLLLINHVNITKDGKLYQIFPAEEKLPSVIFENSIYKVGR